MTQKLLVWTLFSLSMAITTISHAAVYKLPLPGNDVIGQVKTTYALPGQTLDDIARQYDVGHYEIIEANPTVNPTRVLPFEKITIPAQYILPPGPRQGIVINLAELRLFYYPQNSNTVETFPVGIGMFGNVTPEGEFEIIEKMDHPVWHVPKQVQRDLAKRGILVPKVMAAGPDNPLGDYALRLNNWSYLIHGTNEPPTIGRRASSGCLHMFPEDIEGLFPKVPNHTHVSIINMPFKAGWSGNNLYFEAHQPLHETRTAMGRNHAVYWNKAIKSAVEGINPSPKINWPVLKTVGTAQAGIPEVIAKIT